MRNIEKYSDIQNSDCAFYSGKQLKHFYSCHTGFYQLSFESVKDNKRECQIYNPYSDLDDNKVYQCFEYSRVSGAGIEYHIISILNY